MKEENVVENLRWEACVLETTAHCVREKAVERVDFLSFLLYTVNDIRRKPYMVETHSTVEKRVKRTPDPTVETTC